MPRNMRNRQASFSQRIEEPNGYCYFYPLGSSIRWEMRKVSSYLRLLVVVELQEGR